MGIKVNIENKSSLFAGSTKATKSLPYWKNIFSQLEKKSRA